MEENNYRDEFEFFLKENVDEFKMVPSRKVWYSIYNNLHPDRKWPSMAVCLFILTAVLYIGIANNNSLSNTAKKASSENFSNLLNDKNIDNKITFSAKDYATVKNSLKQTFSIVSTQKNDFLLNTFEKEIDTSNAVSLSVTNKNFYTNNIENSTVLKTIGSVNDFNAVNNNTAINYNEKNIESETSVNYSDPENQITETSKKVETTSNLISDILPIKLNTSQTFEPNNNLSTIQKSWVEDYAFRNKPAINKFKQKTTLSYYLTPSFGYRIFSKAGDNTTTYSSVAAARTNNNPVELFDNTALNLETGAILQYSLSKRLRLKGGLQANYTNYVSNVTALGHPSLTSLTMNNNSNNIRSSNFSTKAGNDKINRTSLQIALPIGADFKIAGNQTISWYAGGNIQPTYVLGGNAYVLSADEKYYISENTLLRKINLNTSVETFISFKSSKGIVLNVGPQFRYQLLSTYKKSYGYTEKVYNVGVKVGVTTTF